MHGNRKVPAQTGGGIQEKGFKREGSSKMCVRGVEEDV